MSEELDPDKIQVPSVEASPKGVARMTPLEVGKITLVITLLVGACVAVVMIDRYQNRQYEKACELFDMASIHIDTGNFGMAVKELTESLSLIEGLDDRILANEYFAPYYHNRGLAHLLSDDPDSAIVDFNESLRRRRNNAGTILLRGRAYLAKGELQKADDDFNRVIELASSSIRANQNDVDAYRLRARAYMAKGNRKRANLDFDRAEAWVADNDPNVPNF